MRELSIEEKARAYDEAIEKVRDLTERLNPSGIDKSLVQEIFPRLKEQDDAEAKRSLEILLQHFCKGYRVPGLDFHVSYKTMLDWVEEQEKKDDEIKKLKEDVEALKKTAEESKEIASEDVSELSYMLGRVIRRYINDPNIDYNKRDFVSKKIVPYVNMLEKSRNQKPVALVKFRVGDEIKTVNEEPVTITRIDDKGYWSGDLYICGFDDAVCWDLVKHDPIERNTGASSIDSDLNDYCCKIYDALYKENGGCLSFARLQHMAMDIQRWCNKQKDHEEDPKDEKSLKLEQGKWYVCIAQYGNLIEGRSYKSYSNGSIKDDFGTEYIMYVDAEKWFRPWTIEDVRDGDILTNDNMIVIFKRFSDPVYRRHIIAYAGVDTSGDLQVTDGDWVFGDIVHPASKDQQTRLNWKIREAGYFWDSSTHELKILSD